MCQSCFYPNTADGVATMIKNKDGNMKLTQSD